MERKTRPSLVREGASGLVHQSDTVGKEQHALHPTGAHQEIDQRDHGTGLARTRRHHQQRLALAVFLEVLGDGADGALLIGPLVTGNRRTDFGLGQFLAPASSLDQKLQFVALVEAADLARRVARVVPNPVLVTVGIEDHRPLAVTRFQAVGVKLGLLLALPRILAGALGLHQPERLAVGAP